MPGFQSTRLVTEGALEPFFFLYTDDSIQGNPETCKQSNVMLNYEVKNSQCAINGRVYTHEKEIDWLNAGLRAFYLEYELQRGKTMEELANTSPDPGRTAIQENLKLQMDFENKDIPFGYPVLNGQGIEPSMIKVYPVKPGDEILLASDGYPVLRGTLAESEKELQRILEEDPLCFRTYRSTKGKKSCNVSFDDRTYCRILV